MPKKEGNERKKLAVRKTTLRRLDDDQLRRVGGGFSEAGISMSIGEAGVGCGFGCSGCISGF